VNNPIIQLKGDWADARKANDPMSNLCALSTVGAEDGRPRVRTLIVWDIRDDGVVLLANTTSPKWREIQRNPHFEATLVWTSIQRQYRLRGEAEALPMPELALLWQRKRYELKLLDHYYSRFQGQSAPVVRAEFLRRMADLESEFPDSSTVPVASSAVGLLLKPQEIDVWNGASRFPERTLFIRQDASWSETSLAP